MNLPRSHHIADAAQTMITRGFAGNRDATRWAPLMTHDTPTAREKRMARDYFFPTPVYYTDLA